MNISKDSFSCVMSFLDSSSVESVSKTNKILNKYTKDLSHIYIETKLIEIWGNSIINLLKMSEDNYRRDIKDIYNKYNQYTVYTQMDMLDLFYSYFCNNQNTSLKHDMFISVYDIIYMLLTTQQECDQEFDSLRVKLYQQRSKYFKMYFLEEDFHKNNKALKNILNVSKTIDRKDEDIIEYNFDIVLQQLKVELYQ